MVAPLMTCSARLPVYALIIGAFIPDRAVGIFNLQGLVLFGLYVLGIVSAMAVAYVFKRVIAKGRRQPLLLELPNYHVPHLRNLALGLWERARIFITRVGTIILALMVILWFLSTFPGAPDGAVGPAIQYSLAGRIGSFLEPLFAPLGFNWQISLSLIPAFAARETAVATLATVYAVGGEEGAALQSALAAHISLASALSLMVWFAFAPQCMSTLAIIRRETQSWRMVALSFGYMFVLAYAASFLTYNIARWLA